MAFPERPWWLPVRLEFAFGVDPTTAPGTWDWTDVSADLDPTQQIQIRRGRPAEAGQVSPATAAPRLVNNSGAYTPDHPMSPHYPHVQQGVPARISVQAGGSYLRVPDAAGARATSVALPTPAEVDVRVELALDRLPGQLGPDAARPYIQEWTEVIGQYVLVPGGRSWHLAVNGNGGLAMQWSVDGTNGPGSLISAQVLAPAPYVSGQRFALRATVESSAGSWTMTAYHALSLEDAWVELGQVTGLGAGPFSLTLPINVGTTIDTYISGAGRYYRAELRDGIDGAVVAAPDFTTAAPGDTSLPDPQGNTWNVQGGAEVTDWRIRLVGTVDEWAPTWPWGDLSDPTMPIERPGEARVDVTISGILRRLETGQPPLQSTLRRRIPSAVPPPLAYWPMEEGIAATSAYSPLPDVAPLQVAGLAFGADGSLGGAGPLPTLGQTSRLYGTISGAAPGGWHAEMVYRLDTMPGTEETVLRLYLAGAAGGVSAVRVRISTAGIRVQALDIDEGVVAFGLFTDPDAVAAFTGGWNRLQIFSYQSGGDCYVRAAWRDVGSGSYWYAGTTWTGSTVGRVTAVRGAWGSWAAGMGIGHLGVWDVGGSGLTTPGVTIYTGADDGYAGERALARMRRLAEEERLPISVSGAPAESPQMGPQGQATLLALLQQCAAVDGGILGERREVAGLQYRSRGMLYNQTTGIALNARANEIDAPFHPVLDDQRLANQITVSRQGGAAVTAEDPESIAARGIYPESYTLNIESDGALPGIAAWLLHHGTWPGMRYPSVTVALHIAPERIADWLDRLEGDRVQVAALPPQHPSTMVDLLAEGLAETLTQRQWRVEVAASPAGPWTVGEIGHDDPAADVAPSHVDTDGSSLYTAVDADDTTVHLWHSAGPEWVTSTGPTGGTAADGDLPFDLRVGGEVVTAEQVEPLRWDAFDRTEVATWGTTSDGFAWQEGGGSASDRAVSAGTGRLTLSAPATTPRQQVLLTALLDTEMTVRVSVDQLATGGSLVPQILLRFVSASEYYAVRVHFTAGGAVFISAGLSGAMVGAAVPTGYSYTPGAEVGLRVRLDGDRLRARVWPVSRPEPGGWPLDRTITTGAIPVGYVGVGAQAFGANSNTNPVISFARWEIRNPQWAQVTRAVNGVVKGHAAGTDVRLAHPMIIAL